MPTQLIENLQISNFKCFKQLDVNGLAQVNLIGGKNNVGKTAFLEAVELLLAANKAYDLPDLIRKQLERRQGARRRDLIEIDFFHQGATEITLLSSSKACTIKSSFDLLDSQTTIGNDEADNFLPTNILTLSVNHDKITRPIDRLFNRIASLRPIGSSPDRKPFISSAKSDEYDIAISFGTLIDLGREDFLNASLALFDSNICGLKQKATERGVLLKLKLNNQDNLVLLSSLGEGVNRYIAILCAIWANKDGFLLIDEIENGIHYTNYKKLWEIIFKVSSDANCQLFITTHSKECISAFNAVQLENNTAYAQYFEFYQNLKTGLIAASAIDKQQLHYALTHEGRVRGE
ncbi:ATP-binding protein [Methylovulum psychrotolerans]|uniref:AAA family ATPase n=1 Tax=Methylovulum psychrotolerans TaxID=1704499 RepID=UPI001BFF495B|nr:AAA family ATPase [Methylovulum psychrotolerans]MBT9096994.1 ATP-binding protein [Methylovulum psychrotolerans]